MCEQCWAFNDPFQRKCESCGKLRYALMRSVSLMVDTESTVINEEFDQKVPSNQNLDNLFCETINGGNIFRYCFKEPTTYTIRKLYT